MSLTTTAAQESMTVAVTALQKHLDAELAGRRGLRVLDAGCGGGLSVTLPPDSWLVGVDEDEAALSRNQQLDETVVADLTRWEPPGDSFDMIVSWWVLEHLPHPEQALARFARGVRPGGLVVLAFPNVWCPKSLVAKLTPHRFHVWLFRRVLRRPLAGTPGYAPYPTTLRLAIAPRRLLRHARGLGLELLHLGWFEDPKQRRIRHRLRVTGWAWRVVQGLVTLVSLGKLNAARTDLVLLLRRPMDG